MKSKSNDMFLTVFRSLKKIQIEEDSMYIEKNIFTVF